MFSAYRARRGGGGLSWRLLPLFITVISVTLSQTDILRVSNIGKGGTNATNVMTESAIDEASYGSAGTTRNNTETLPPLPHEGVTERGTSGLAHHEKAFMNISSTVNRSNPSQIRESILTHEEKSLLNISNSLRDGYPPKIRENVVSREEKSLLNTSNSLKDGYPPKIRENVVSREEKSPMNISKSLKDGYPPKIRENIVSREEKSPMNISNSLKDGYPPKIRESIVSREVKSFMNISNALKESNPSKIRESVVTGEDKSPMNIINALKESNPSKIRESVVTGEEKSPMNIINALKESNPSKTRESVVTGEEKSPMNIINALKESNPSKIRESVVTREDKSPMNISNALKESNPSKTRESVVTGEEKSPMNISNTIKESSTPEIKKYIVTHEEKNFAITNNTASDDNPENVSAVVEDGDDFNETHEREYVSTDEPNLSTTTKSSLDTPIINTSNNDNDQLANANMKRGEEYPLNQTIIEKSVIVSPSVLLLGGNTGNENQEEMKMEIVDHKDYGIPSTESSMPLTSLKPNTKQVLTNNSSQVSSTMRNSTDDTTTVFSLADNKLKVSFPQRRSVKKNSISRSDATLSPDADFSSRVKFTETNTLKNASKFQRRDSTNDLLVSRNVSTEYIYECPRYCSCFVLTSRLRCHGPWVTTSIDNMNHRYGVAPHSNTSIITQVNNSSTEDNGYAQPSTSNATNTHKKKHNNFLPFKMKELELQHFFVPVLNLSALMRAFEDHFILKKSADTHNSSKTIAENNTQLSNTSIKSSAHSTLHGIHHEVVHVVFNPNSLTNPISIFIGEGRRLQYKKLEHITDLTIRDCNVTRIVRKTLGALPKLVRLDLSRNAITHIHPRSFLGLSHLIRLDLNRNSIRNISRAFVHLRNLEVLNLQGNLLTTLNANTFIGLSKITYLNLGHNLIANVDIAAFQHLRSLSTLVLRDNPLSTLVRLNFFGSKLQYIDMSNIKIDKVPQVITQSIKNLRVSGNNLRTIQRGDLDAYPYLGELDLEQNGLEVLEEDALGRHEYLTRLFMGNNRLMEVPQSLPISLAELYLQMNQINALREGDFRGLTSLEQLFLFDNNISYVSDTALIDLVNLRTLSLRTNKIQTLGSNIFSKLSKLSSLDLSENLISSLGGGVFVGLQHLQVLHLTFIQSLEIAISVDVFNPLQALEVLNLENSPSLCKQITNSTEILKSLSSLREIYLVRCDLTQLPVDLRTLLPRLQEVKLTEDNNVTSKNVITRRTRRRKGTKRSLADTNHHTYNPRSYQGNGDGGKGKDAGNDTTAETATGTGSHRAVVASSLLVSTLGQGKGGAGTDRRTKKKVGRGKYGRTWLVEEEKRIVDLRVAVKGEGVQSNLKATASDGKGKGLFGNDKIFNTGNLDHNNVEQVGEKNEGVLDFTTDSQHINLEKDIIYNKGQQDNTYAVTIASLISKRSQLASKSKQKLETEIPLLQSYLNTEEMSREKSIINLLNLPSPKISPLYQTRGSTEASVTAFINAELHPDESYHGTTTVDEPSGKVFNGQTVSDVPPKSHYSTVSTDIQTIDSVFPTLTVPLAGTKSNDNSLMNDIPISTTRDGFGSMSEILVTEVSIPLEVLDMPMSDDSDEQDLESGFTEIGVEKFIVPQTQKSANLRSHSPDADTTLGGFTGPETSPKTYLSAGSVQSTPFKRELDWIQVKPTLATQVPIKHTHKIVRKQMQQPTAFHSQEGLDRDVADDELQIQTGSNTKEDQNPRFGDATSQETNFFGGSESQSENFFDPSNEKPDIEVIEEKATKNMRKYEYDTQTKQMGNSKSSMSSISGMGDSETNLPQLTTLSENSSEVHINRDTYLYRGDSRYELHNILKQHSNQPDTASEGGVIEEVDGHVHFNKIFDLFDHRKALSLGVTFVATVMVFVTFGAMFMFAIIRIKFGMNQIFMNRLYRGTTAVGERLSRSNSLNCESPYRENVQTRVGNRLALNGPGSNKGTKGSVPSSNKKFTSTSSGKLFSGALMTSKMSRIKKSEEIRAALLDNVGLGEYEGGALTPPSPLPDDIPPVILKTRSSFDDVALACDDTCIDLDDRTLETCQDCNNLLVGNLHGDSGIHIGYRESPSRSSSGDGDLYQPESPRLDHLHHHHSHSVLSEDPSFARIFNATEDPLDSGSRCVSDCSGIPDDYNFSNFPTTTSCPLTKNFRGPQMDEVYDNVPADVLVLGSSPLDGRRYAQ